MISGRNSDTTYEQTENLNPGNTSSVQAAPPRMCRRSSTRTLRPAFARYAAVVRPLWPPPMTMTSYFVLLVAGIVNRASRGESDSSFYRETSFLSLYLRQVADLGSD